MTARSRNVSHPLFSIPFRTCCINFDPIRSDHQNRLADLTILPKKKSNLRHSYTTCDWSNFRRFIKLIVSKNLNRIFTNMTRDRIKFVRSNYRSVEEIPTLIWHRTHSVHSDTCEVRTFLGIHFLPVTSAMNHASRVSHHIRRR